MKTAASQSSIVPVTQALLHLNDFIKQVFNVMKIQNELEKLYGATAEWH